MRVLFEHVYCPIRGTAIHHDMLNIRIILAGHAVQRGADGADTVEARGNNRDFHFHQTTSIGHLGIASTKARP